VTNYSCFSVERTTIWVVVMKEPNRAGHHDQHLANESTSISSLPDTMIDDFTASVSNKCNMALDGREAGVFRRYMHLTLSV
jgi:hypothetical protein